MLKIFFGKEYIYELPPGHRFPIAKYELVMQQLLHEGYAIDETIVNPGIASFEQTMLTHTAAYWSKLHQKELSNAEVRKIGLPIHERSVAWARNAAAGAIEAALYAFEKGVGLSLAGGTHHAYADHGEGFCILNDVAVAANFILSKKLAQKILIIDLDVHQGNGTAAIFTGNPNVFTFSMHCVVNYPLVKEKSDWDIPLASHMEDNAYLSILKDALEKLPGLTSPDIVFYVAGVDVLAGDALGRLSLSKQACRHRDEMVLEFCRKSEIPVAITMGGGYSPKIKDIVDAHSATFKTAIDIFH